MTFSELTQELILQGWRAYKVENIRKLINSSLFINLSKRHNLEIRTYENQSVIFIKTIQPKLDIKPKK